MDAKADEVLIKFRGGAASAEKEKVFALLKAAPAPRKMAALQKIRYQRVPVPAGVTLDDFLTQVRKAAAVESAEVNPVLRLQSLSPDDPFLDEQWGLKAIQAPQAWEVTPGDPSVVIAVVDSGIDSDHPDLVANLVPGYNFILRARRMPTMTSAMAHKSRASLRRSPTMAWGFPALHQDAE